MTTGTEVLRATLARQRRRLRKERLIVQVGIVTLGVGILVFWEYGLRYLVNIRYTSIPTAIVTRLLELARAGHLWQDIRVTMLEAGGGYLIGVIAGLLGALILASYRRGYEVLEPFLVGFYSIPKIALAPLFIMWFGLGIAPKLILATLMVFFIVFMNTVAGIHSISAGLVDVTRVLGARGVALATKVVLPAATPAIMASVRVTFSRAMVGAILAEFIAATQGLGHMIVRASRQFDTPAVFAGIIIISILVMAVNGGIRLLESRLVPWQSQEVHG
ncbi:MAG: ABC transporter permease [Acidimicrobiia bacterium]